MTEEKKQSLHEISNILCAAYNLLYAQKEVFFPLEEEHVNKLDSIVKTVYGTWFGVTRFPTYKDKAVAFLCLIIKDHPFIDGNKRTAVLWFQVFCDVWGLNINTKIPLDVLAVSIEGTKNINNDNLFSIVKKLVFLD